MDHHPERVDRPVRPTRIEYEESPRIFRIRVLSNLLDTSIRLPGGYRIGIDPLIGLIPGIGDFIGAALSSYIIYEAARLGLRKSILLRMCGNVLVETLVGEIPILGDIFDAVWKANVRNARLVELHYQPGQPERSNKQIAAIVLFMFFLIITAAVAFGAGLLWLLLSLFR